MTLAISLLSFAVVFSLMIFVHEFGHFIVAKRSGVRVREFGFGYPLAADKPPSERRLCWQIARDKAGTVYSVNLIPFGGFVNLGENDRDDPESLMHFPKRVRLATLLAGPGMNLLLAFLIFGVAALIGYPQFQYGVAIIAVTEGSPAEAAGLQANDIILSVDDHIVGLVRPQGDAERATLELVNSVVSYVADRPDRPVTVLIQRGLGKDAEQIAFKVTPREDESGEGKMGVQITAVPARIERVHASFLDALKYGALEVFGTIRMTVEIPFMVLRGLIPASSARSVGPVGIARLTGDAVQQSLDVGWAFPILQLAAVLNVAIAVTNLLPLPALDGGRIVFVLIEWIRGKPVSPEKEGMVHGIGLMILLFLLVVITIQDVFVPLPQSFNWADYLY